MRASGAEAGLGRAADREAPVPVDRYHPCGGLVREAHSLFVLPAVRLKYGYGIKSSKEEDEALVPVDCDHPCGGLVREAQTLFYHTT